MAIRNQQAGGTSHAAIGDPGGVVQRGGAPAGAASRTS